MAERDDALVATAAGVVQGSTVGAVHVFKGIPYAAPPVGKRRYRKPIPPPSWDGVRLGVEPGPASLQIDGATGGMVARYRVLEDKDEDCLFLNVWTPDLHGAERPVIIFVHGGGYRSGSGAIEVYDGSHYAEGGVVFVTCNYRLGGLGFMHIDDYFPELDSTGNLGILDVVRMLEWVQENITAFGGDPTNVTLAGSSSGAITAAALLASRLGRGLFRRAVLMSSASGHTTLGHDVAGLIGRRFLDHVGVAPGDLASLETLPADRFILPYGPVWADMTEIADWYPLCPISDGHVLAGPVIDEVARGAGAEVDVMLGSTTDEQRSAYFAEDGSSLPTSLDKASFSTRTWETLFEPSRRSFDDIRRVYARSVATRGWEFNHAEFASAVSSDYVMTIPTVQFADARSSNGGRSFLYRFAWPSPLLDGFLGSFHGLGTPFFFDNLDHPAWAAVLGPEPPTELARGFRESVIGFATDGDPNVGALPYWPLYTTETRETLVLDVPPRVLEDPDGERRELWEGWR